MSVRAYRRITEPKLADHPSFNLWSDTELLDALENLEGTWNGLNQSGGGGIELYIDELEEFLATTKIKIDPATKKQLKADIAASKKEGKEYIYYECY